jgi:apolipoprotein N-acyltransferase
MKRNLVARVVAVVLGAATLSVLAPPLNLAWLHWVAYLPMFWALDPEDDRLNLRLSWLYGTVGLAGLFSWIYHTITVFAPMIPLPATLGILLLFSAVFGAQYVLLWPAVYPLRRALGAWWVLAFPALEVTVEFLAMKLLLFPYQHGVSQFRTPWVWQLASVTGVWGVSFLLFLVNSALAEVMFRMRERRAFPVQVVGAAAATLAAVLGYGAWRYHRVSAVLDAAPVARVAQIQSDLGMEYRMSHSARDAWNWWMAETKKVEPGTADLVIWPEGASPYDLNQDESGRENLAPKVLSEQAVRGGFEMVVGGGTRLRNPDAGMGEDAVSVFNSTYFFRSDGTIAGHYDKMQPLPFGEYLPFQEWLPKGLGRALNIGDFKAGTVPVLFDSAKGKIATPICYEAILPGTCSLFRDADLLVTVTNDAWFGDTANPYQHAMLAACRSIELGIPMVRSAYTGVSFVVEPNGDLHDETRPFEKVNRIVQVKLAKFDTLYARIGNWFPALCALGTLFSLARVRATPGAWTGRRPPLTMPASTSG